MSNLAAMTGLSSTATIIRHTSLFKNRPTGTGATHPERLLSATGAQHFSAEE